jgi:hypothetical protein
LIFYFIPETVTTEFFAPACLIDQIAEQRKSCHGNFSALRSILPFYADEKHKTISPACEAPPRYGYWVQPFSNGSTGYIQPIWVAV